ncbi:exodeoxyribonuclease VII large subunit [Limisalsivibrio acetivorans]|uniref:exodeoxyribonuclease VII large subunit n=1 Tax=Limisalsivibrio acetivorans TaxID=1304888 RepID=UPI0003B30F79|nr:exodeoxyribonuclease VII large subunit [Limisalsivibrio acetivorans]
MQKYTVTEITGAIKGLLEGTFSGHVAVTGEITSLSTSPRGHIYFSLKDEKAKIKAVMFKGSAMANRGYTPRNGDSVQAVGELRVYEPEGYYQIIVKKLEYDSVGLFWQKFEEMKRKLEAEGLFDDERKQKIPAIPSRIAVITSPTGAAIKDFIVTADKEGGRFELDIWPVPVQGKDAVNPVTRAVTEAGSMTERYDVIVLMRGGGSLEDLALFNEEPIARAMAATAVPCISAIGHERDFTICDFVADIRVATPTAAAGVLSEGYANAVRELDRRIRRLSELMERTMQNSAQRLDSLGRRLAAGSPVNALQNRRSRLEYLEKSLVSSMTSALGAEKARYAGLTARIGEKSPLRIIDRYRSRVNRGFDILPASLKAALDKEKNRLSGLEMRIKGGSPLHEAEKGRAKLDRLMYSLGNMMSKSCETRKNRLVVAEGKLAAMNPEKVMERGYAMVQTSKGLIKKAKQVHLEDELEIRFKDGYINSFVTGRKLSEE